LLSKIVMSRPPIQTVCPHCKCRMSVDSLSGEVQAFDPPAEDMEAAALRATAGRQSARKDAFDTALSAEKSRAKDLDDLFKQAAEKQEKKGEDESAPGNALDDRWQ
jgi:hypothetical protein